MKHNEVADTLRDDTARREHIYPGSRAVQVFVDGVQVRGRDVLLSLISSLVLARIDYGSTVVKPPRCLLLLTTLPPLDDLIDGSQRERLTELEPPLLTITSVIFKNTTRFPLADFSLAVKWMLFKLTVTVTDNHN